MKTIHTIINGDSRRMKELAGGSVDLAITSPPYWQLKDYGSSGEIGFNHSYESYINHLNLVWQEVYRVLENGGRLCINIGDQYARSVYYGRYKVIPIRTEIIKFCEIAGFDYMGAIIWQKLPTTNTTGGATIMGSYPYPRNGIMKLDYEFILVFKKSGQPKKKISKEIKEQSRLTKEEWKVFFSGHWNFVGQKQRKHLAMFPLELPHRLIKMFSFVGDTVLDPFLGSGTTTLAALRLNRNSVGYEINPDSIPVIKDKLREDEIQRVGRLEVGYENQEPRVMDFDKEIKKLPYIFKDPVKLDKKVDPKKMKFNSKIDKNSSKMEKYYFVREIVSPGTLILSDDSKIRLIGIKENEDQKERAMDFLKNKLKGQNVFLRYDQTKNHDQEEKWCYLYLRNKTFINAHLLKNKLVQVDESYEFKYKKKFLKLR